MKIPHFQIFPDVPWLYLGSTCIEVVFLVSDDKLKFCPRILQKQTWSKTSVRLSDIKPSLSFLGTTFQRNP